MSRRIIYYNNSTEYHVYVVEMLRPRDHGDHDTTLFLRAMEVGLGYRFMFLEALSDFSPAVFQTEDLQDFRKRVVRMINSLNLLIHTSKAYELDNPKSIIMIIGRDVTEKIEELYTTWNTKKHALYEAAKSIIIADNISYVDRTAFISVLNTFCESKRGMNRDYTTRALHSLTDRISKESAKDNAQRAS
jgi:hypothetical protein